MIWKPVLIGGPIDPLNESGVLDRVLEARSDGLPPSVIKVREIRPIDFYELVNNIPFPDPLCVYRLQKVVGGTAFYEFVNIES